MKEKTFIDCQKGTANCCKDNFIELTLDEFERFYDKAPIGIGVKVYPHREEQYFFRYAGIYFYFSFGIIVNAGCIFLDENKCSIYEDRPGMCQIFPVRGHDKKLKKFAADLDFCKECGQDCVNDIGEGFEFSYANRLSKPLEDKAKKVFRKLKKDKVILNKQVFKSLYDHLKGNYPKELMSILLEAVSAYRGKEDLWLSPIDPHIYFLIEDFLKKRNLDAERFYEAQLKFLTEMGTIKKL